MSDRNRERTDMAAVRQSLKNHLERRKAIILDGSVRTPDQSELQDLKSVLRTPSERRRSPVRRLHSDRSDPGSPRKLRTNTPQRQRRVVARMKKDLSERTVAIRAKNERIGHDSLKNIADHKSTIAEMRPARRKIRWNMAKDAEKSPGCSNTRIPGLNLRDLSFHGCNPCHRTEKEQVEAGIEHLEQSIRRCLQSLERVNKDIEKDKEIAEKTRVENRELRRKLISMPVPQNQSIRQAQKQLESTIEILKQKISSVDEHVTLMNCPSDALEDSLANDDFASILAPSLLSNESSAPCRNEKLSTGEKDVGKIPILTRQGSFFVSPRSRRAPKTTIKASSRKPKASPITPRRKLRGEAAKRKKRILPQVPSLSDEANTLERQVSSLPAAA